MRIKNLFLKGISVLTFILTIDLTAQAPVADFTISPNPICSGAVNTVQVTDNSSNSPTAWSYTISNGGPGVMTNTLQNPVLSFNMQGTYTVILIATNGSGASIPVSHTITVLASPNAQINPLTQTTCIGGNSVAIGVLTGGPAAASLTFSWSTGITGTSISVLPNTTTVYTCVITSTNGCSSQRTATVVIGQPTINITSNPVNICPGNSSTITATGTTPGPFTYSWSTGVTTRTISTSVAGIYTVEVTNGNGCSATQTYSIASSTTLALTAIAVPSVLCVGNTATLHATGASSYTWSTGAATQNSSVSPATTMVYTVTGQVGTCTGSASISLIVNTTPTITVSADTQTVCAGNTAVLTASGATTYIWIPSMTSSQSLSITPTGNTTYTVRGTNPGCQSRTATISIAVSPNPVVTVSSSSSVICAGEVVALAASGAGSYSWSEGGRTAVILVTPTITTTYSVTGANSSNCTFETSITQIVNACLGINAEGLEITNLKLYPNPNNGNFIISSDSKLDLKIISQSGQMIRSVYLKASEAYIISDLSSGMYFLIGQNGETPVKQKIIVLK